MGKTVAFESCDYKLYNTGSVSIYRLSESNFLVIDILGKCNV